MLFLDFETKSACDIRKAGADAYARHPTTDILCVGYTYADEKIVHCVKPEEIRERAIGSLIWQGIPVVAHNAPFELAIWNHVGVRHYGWPRLKPEQTICTMAMAYSAALPGALADAAPASGLTVQKDSAGHRIMLQLSQPRARDEDCLFCEDGCAECITWWTPEDVPEKFEKLYAYCRQDIEVERQLYNRLLKLSSKEREIWLLDHKINQRGVQVDLKAVDAAMELVEMEKKRLNLELNAVTRGAVSVTSATGQLTDWIRSRGVETEGVAKSDVLELLGRDTIPADVREALLLRQEAAKSSTAKLKAMRLGACDDGRLRGMFQYYGAGATGRWAGRRVQLQNLPRPVLSQKQIEEVFEVLTEGETRGYR